MVKKEKENTLTKQKLHACISFIIILYIHINKNNVHTFFFIILLTKTLENKKQLYTLLQRPKLHANIYFILADFTRHFFFSTTYGDYWVWHFTQTQLSKPKSLFKSISKKVSELNKLLEDIGVGIGYLRFRYNRHVQSKIIHNGIYTPIHVNTLLCT